MLLEERSLTLLVAETAVFYAYWALKFKGKNPEWGLRRTSERRWHLEVGARTWKEFPGECVDGRWGEAVAGGTGKKNGMGIPGRRNSIGRKKKMMG